MKPGQAQRARETVDPLGLGFHGIVTPVYEAALAESRQIDRDDTVLRRQQPRYPGPVILVGGESVQQENDLTITALQVGHGQVIHHDLHAIDPAMGTLGGD
jgi:hypothetical protein